MSILKSPVFYLGLLLVLLVGGALVAPFVVNWNSYRDNLETYGAKISGRQVAINGPIAVRLFPWPRLEAEDVSVANPKGVSGDAMMQAGKVTVHLALGGLFSGQIQVESIDVERPVVKLTMDKLGVGNWHFMPDAALAKTGLLNNVLLEKINIVDGVLNFDDGKHGISRKLISLNGVASAAAMEGPWRIIASAKDGETPLDVSWSSTAWKAGAPLKFGLKIAPRDGAFPAFHFDGDVLDGHLTGTANLLPVVTDDGRTSLEGSFKPLTYQSKVDVLGDVIKLDGIHIVPADSKDNGTLIEGDAVIDLARGAKAEVHLKAPHVNLDGLAGASSLRVWRAGGIMALANQVLAAAPASLDLSGSLEASSLTVAGENLENVSLKATAAQSAIRVKDLTADLPGRSRMKFSGIVFPGDGAAELGGSLAFESNDTRGFTEWLWPEGKAAVDKIWTGARGRMKAQSDVNWGGKRFGFQNLQYELDGLGGKAELAVALGKIPAIDLKLSAKQFDLGSYISGGLAGLFASDQFVAGLSSSNGFEKRLQFDFDKVMLNGVTADRVAVNYASSVSGFEVKKFSIGSVEGAEVAGNGLVLIGPDGPSGEVKFAVGAEHPQGLMRLLGFMPKGQDPRWAASLGKTDVKAEVSVKPGAAEPLVSFSLLGDSGPVHIVSSGTAKDLAQGADANLGFSGTVSSADAHDVARLLGADVPGLSGGEGSLAITADGNAAQGFKTALDFEGFATSVGFSGRYLPQANHLGYSGTLNVIAEDAASVVQALALPIIATDVGPLSLKADVLPDKNGLSISALRMDFAEQTIIGKGNIAANGQLNLQLQGGKFKVLDMLALGLGQAQGKLQLAWPFGILGGVSLMPLDLLDPFGVALREPKVELKATAEGKNLSIAAKDGEGAAIGMKGTLVQKGIGFAFDGNVHYPIDVALMMRKADGKPAMLGSTLLDGQFHSESRSVQGLITGLTGTGMADTSGLFLQDVSPDEFFAGLKGLSKPDDIQAAFATLFSGKGVALSNQKISFEAKESAVKFSPLDIVTPESEIFVEPHVDLVTAEFSTTVTLKSKTQNELPAMRIIYQGVPGLLAARSDVAALSAKLGTALIAKDMAALDQVQKEQAKIVADQAAQAQVDKEKFEAFQAQRLELRQRLKEQKVFAAQRALDAARYKASVDAAIAEGNAVVKEEKRRLLQLVQ
jgi:AsmA family